MRDSIGSVDGRLKEQEKKQHVLQEQGRVLARIKASLGEQPMEETTTVVEQRAAQVA